MQETYTKYIKENKDRSKEKSSLSILSCASVPGVIRVTIVSPLGPIMDVYFSDV